jgi:DNA end-binding protein Ku
LARLPGKLEQGRRRAPPCIGALAAAQTAPAAGNVVDLMEALRRSVGKEQPSKATKKPRKAAAGQKEMLLAISGKKPAKENAAKKTTSKPHRKSA